MTTTTHAPHEAAILTGLTIDTLRYYEKEGLVGPISRESGHRVYTDDDVAWISLVTCLRDAGLGIADLRHFTALLRSTGPTADRVTFLKQRQQKLRDRANAITTALAVLDTKITWYSTHDTDEDHDHT